MSGAAKWLTATARQRGLTGQLSLIHILHLTTVERNMGDIAREGTRVLLRRLDEGIVDNRRVYLNNRLIVRDTVRNLNEG